MRRFFCVADSTAAANQPGQPRPSMRFAATTNKKSKLAVQSFLNYLYFGCSDNISN